MRIAIDASPATKHKKTGIEGYAEGVITELLRQDRENEFLLYSKEPVPEHIIQGHPRAKTRYIKWPRLWSLGGLSKAVWQDSPDVLFVPAGILPPVHPKRSFVVVHGLEYEAFPQSYSVFQFWHLVVFTRWSAWRARTVFVPSEHTKHDLAGEYGISTDKIQVAPPGIPSLAEDSQEESSEQVAAVMQGRFIFWLGRKERRKNVETLVRTFEMLTERGWDDLSLVLAGPPGEGYRALQQEIAKSSVRERIYDWDYVTDTERDELYTHAACFVFPSFYEGFGIPVLEAQSHGTPVVASNSSSVPEAGGEACLYASPDSPEAFAGQIELLLRTPQLQTHLEEAGKEHAAQFSFEQTVSHIREAIEKKVE